MTNKILFGTLVTVFLLSAIALGFYSYKLFTTPKQKKITPLVKITNVVGSPITKNITVDNKVVYEIEGFFANNPLKYGNGPLYKGDFVVRGDVLKQNIPVFLGNANGDIFLGNYKKVGGMESRRRIFERTCSAWVYP